MIPCTTMRAARVALACAALGSCVDLSPYTCTRDEDCVRESAKGICGPAGHCAYSDALCPSGWRYSELAGVHANACTEPSSDSAGDGTTSGIAAEVSSDDAEPDLAPMCGNGVVEAGEECDDGNAVDGDGCNSDCTLSGRLRWSVTHAGGGAAYDVARAVTRLAGGGLATTGFVTDEDGTRSIWVARYDAEGTQTWSLALGHEGRQDEGFDIVQGANANLYVAGFETPPELAAHAWVGAITPDGEVVWTRNPQGGQARAVSTLANQIVTVGVRGGRTFAEVYTPTGGQAYRVETETTGAPRPDALHLVQSSDAWVTGRRSGNVWLGRLGPDSFETVATHTGGVGAPEWGQSVLVSDGLVFVAGFEIVETAADSWVGAYDHRGILAWEYRPTPAPVSVNEEAEGLALDPQGRLVVVGFGTLDHRYGWLAKLDPETGQEIWHRSYHDELDVAHTARGLTVAPDGTIYVVGEIRGEDGSLDAWIAAFDP